jgi:hypothetical protein
MRKFYYSLCRPVEMTRRPIDAVSDRMNPVREDHINRSDCGRPQTGEVDCVSYRWQIAKSRDREVAYVAYLSFRRLRCAPDSSI